MSTFLGITRERVYSPGKVDDDRAILEAVAARLAAEHEVRILSSEARLADPPPSALVFTMCQGPEALATLRGWQRQGIRIINSPAAIESCHRRRMLAAFDRARVSHPPSFIVSTSTTANALPDWVDGGAWLKRGDVHATEPDDVVRVGDADAARVALDRFRSRGISAAVIQQHVRGDVVKFYAVRGRFFQCFPPDGGEWTSAKNDRLRALAEQGAAALGLEVFGGDCVYGTAGDLWLIDLNDWPSYGRCRNAAADAISAYLAAQLE